MAALQYLETQRVAQPELAEWYDSFTDFYQRKLWHQLICKLLQFFCAVLLENGDGDVLIDIYHNFITDFDEAKIRSLTLAVFAGMVCHQYKDAQRAIQHLENVIEKLKASREWPEDEPVLYLKMHIGKFRLQRGERRECKLLLDEGKSTLASMTDVDPIVHATLHWMSSEYYKATQEFADFYKSSLLCLAYSHLEKLPESYKAVMAGDLCVAALLGDNIYNFRELFAHPVVKSLVNTSEYWLYNVLEAFTIGDLSMCEQLSCANNADINDRLGLPGNERKLLEKSQILFLMEIFFSLPSEKRIVSLSELAQYMRVSVVDVEMLLLKCLSVHLIEGAIDQTDGTVRVSWVRPRVLGVEQIELLKDRLDVWTERIHTTLLAVEADTPDLVSSISPQGARTRQMISAF